MNILNPIDPFSINLTAPDYETEITVPGTLKFFPITKQTTISFLVALTAGAGTQIDIYGNLIADPYSIAYVGPGFWFPDLGVWTKIESGVAGLPLLTSVDVEFFIHMAGLSFIACTLSFKDFKITIPSKTDYLPILGIG